MVSGGRLPARRRGNSDTTIPAAAAVELELPPDPKSVHAARSAVSDLARQCGAAVADVALCVSEAVTNAVIHAFRDRSDGSGTIRVLAECLDDGSLRVIVEDDGIGMRPRPDSPGLGLGLPLITSIAGALEVSVKDPGSAVCMRFATGR